MSDISFFKLFNISENQLSDYSVRLNDNLLNFNMLDSYYNHRELLLEHIHKMKWGEGVRYNISTRYVLQFVKLDPRHRDLWLFIGLSRILEGEHLDTSGGKDIVANYHQIDDFRPFEARLVVQYMRPPGPSGNAALTLNMAKSQVRARLVDQMVVHHIAESPISAIPFPGYEMVRLTHNQLQAAVQNAEWTAALGSVQAVYLQTDLRNGWHYVGSAYSHSHAKRGLLSRWAEYANGDFSGGNKNLKDLGAEYIHSSFQYSILEIFDMRVKASEIIRREHWWMDTLDSVRYHRDGAIPHGYNTVREREREESED